MLISLLKFLRKMSKLPWMEEFLMPVKDVDRGEEAGGGY